MAIEEAKYEVVKKSNNFEIRDDTPHIVAETLVVGNLEDAGSKAFKILFGYISGENRSRIKVEMTAPVSQQADPEKIKMTAPVGQQRMEDKWAVRFMMPASYSLETWINDNGHKIAGDPLWALYNAPFTPWFLRRNEILIPIATDVN